MIPKWYVTVIHKINQQTKMIAFAKSNVRCCKQTEHRKFLVTTNLVSIVSSTGKKVKKHELDDIKSIIGCS